MSQPEVRGTYIKDNDGSKEFVVRRQLDESDARYQDYAKPGFRLIDTGRFLLGHDASSAYPDWFTNASFQVYRVISQDVSRFWQCYHDKAKELNLADDEEGVRKLAGDLAAKAVGRWWDGTPLIFGKPLSGLHYPPKEAVTETISGKERSKFQGVLGLKNGFNFATKQAAWSVEGNEIAPKGTDGYAADPLGRVCPFGAHIRKIQPRDDAVDEGTADDTLKRRMLRRGNNFGTRVSDVFAPDDGESRGLLFVAYVADIFRQFEFVQRSWANSSTLPKLSGEDLVIGNKDERSIPIELDTDDEKLQVTLAANERFTRAKGMNYNVVLTKTAIVSILNAPSTIVEVE